MEKFLNNKKNILQELDNLGLTLSSKSGGFLRKALKQGQGHCLFCPEDGCYKLRINDESPIHFYSYKLFLNTFQQTSKSLKLTMFN